MNILARPMLLKTFGFRPRAIFCRLPANGREEGQGLITRNGPHQYLALTNRPGGPYGRMRSVCTYDLSQDSPIQTDLARLIRCLLYGEDKNISLVLHCASLLRTIFASSARAHERVHAQNVKDFPQTKLDNGINSPFLLNEHGDPDFFSRYLLSTV